jgi:chaperonin GroES
MQLRPLGDRVIVKPAAKEEMTKAGIILPDTASKEHPEQGEVIAVGPGRLLESGSRSQMNLKVGDKVVFKKYSPDEVKVGDVEYLVLSENEILAVIE